uniref:Uncharacterized protein n=1 Tax=Cucumis melo TaxID=3656 RepID=A0A9I9EJ18_CUCME
MYWTINFWDLWIALSTNNIWMLGMSYAKPKIVISLILVKVVIVDSVTFHFLITWPSGHACSLKWLFKLMKLAKKFSLAVIDMGQTLDQHIYIWENLGVTAI